MNDPINKSLTVPLDTEAAFALFTDEIDTWWPKESHSVKGAASKITFPDHKGGNIIETAADGSASIWGTIIAYDPATYLAFTWHPGRPDTGHGLTNLRGTTTRKAWGQCSLQQTSDLR